MSTTNPEPPKRPTGKERLAATLKANGVTAPTSTTPRPHTGTSSTQLRARATISPAARGGEEGGRGKQHYGPSDVVKGGEGPLNESGSSVVRSGAAFVEGDSSVVMAAYPPESVDLIFTDPGIGDQAWEFGVPGALFWEQMLRVLKPGGYLAFFSSRKYGHRAMTRAEEAGFDPVDSLLWVYPRGMPTGLDLGQATAKKTGGSKSQYFRTIGSMSDAEREEFQRARANPWDGWSTELRPTWEPIPIFQKPREGSYASNLLTHGVGGMNIDATRIPTAGRDAIATFIPDGQGEAHGLALTKFQQVVGETSLGRWPADALFSHTEDCQPGVCGAGCAVRELESLSEGTAKLFYCPKADRREKDLGLAAGENQIKGVKPIEVCRWVLDLLAPPGGTILDPFCGSGNIALGAVRLDGTPGFVASSGIRPYGYDLGEVLRGGWRFVGIDVDPVAIQVATRRFEAFLTECG